MGLSESKVLLETDDVSSSAENAKEIGICPMWDPRSPSHEFERTPVFERNDRVTLRDGDVNFVKGDPRSPSNEITRTPVGGASTTDKVIENELRSQLERLRIHNSVLYNNTTDSTENLGIESESTQAVDQQKTVLKLLDDVTDSSDSLLWLPSTPPCPKSRSTPKDGTPNSPDTPATCKKETDDLIKRRKVPSRKQHGSQKTDKLQKKVLKKSLATQETRSPLAERNVTVSQVDKSASHLKTKTAKSTAFVKYRKYNSLEESFNDSFVGKENEKIIW